MLAKHAMCGGHLALAFQHIDLSPFVQGLSPLVFFTAALRSEMLTLAANVACQRILNMKLDMCF